MAAQRNQLNPSKEEESIALIRQRGKMDKEEERERIRRRTRVGRREVVHRRRTTYSAKPFAGARKDIQKQRKRTAYKRID